MLLVMVMCALFLAGLVPLMNHGHLILAVLWMVLWIAGVVIAFIKAKK